MSCSYPAIIPARGGSKGIPLKNIANVAGRPLIAWVIEAARNSKAVSRVLVATDHDGIAQVARHWGAEVVHRPPEISADTSSSESVLMHVINDARLADERFFFLQCTSPLTLPCDIDGTMAVMDAGGYDVVFAGIRQHPFLWTNDSAGKCIPVNHPRNHRPMRQQLPPTFMENGAIYALNTAGFLKAGYRFFGNVGVYDLPRRRSLDIDELEDLALAETMLFRRKRLDHTLPWDRIRLIVSDFDGVMTDDCVYLDQNGQESVQCSRADGMGIALLKAMGYEILCLTSEQNSVVARRCEKLKIPCLQCPGRPKNEVLAQYLDSTQISYEQVLYLGNDVNDLTCLREAAIGAAPADAWFEILSVVDWVASKRGGEGVLRELAEQLKSRRSS